MSSFHFRASIPWLLIIFLVQIISVVFKLVFLCILDFLLISLSISISICSVGKCKSCVFCLPSWKKISIVQSAINLADILIIWSYKWTWCCLWLYNWRTNLSWSIHCVLLVRPLHSILYSRFSSLSSAFLLSSHLISINISFMPSVSFSKCPTLLLVNMSLCVSTSCSQFASLANLNLFP